MHSVRIDSFESPVRRDGTQIRIGGDEHHVSVLGDDRERSRKLKTVQGPEVVF